MFKKQLTSDTFRHGAEEGLGRVSDATFDLVAVLALETDPGPGLKPLTASR